jgi:hypothetical protein
VLSLEAVMNLSAAFTGGIEAADRGRHREEGPRRKKSEGQLAISDFQFRLCWSWAALTPISCSTSSPSSS